MTEFSQKYAIVQLLEDIPEGYQFSCDNWPLHSTVVDTFDIDWDVQIIVKELSNTLVNHAAANSVAIDETFLGPRKQTKVVLLKKTKRLLHLHNDVVNLLEQGNISLNDPQFAREGFLPHSTIQKHNRLNIGEKVDFKALSIIDMFPNSDPYQRKVLKTIQIY